MWKQMTILLSGKRTSHQRFLPHDHDDDHSSHQRVASLPSTRIKRVRVKRVKKHRWIYSTPNSRVNQDFDESNRTFLQQESCFCNDGDQQSCPLLYSLTRRWVFPAVNIRIQTHPHEVNAMFCDKQGDTLLHWACFGHPPFETIRAFLSVCPELATVRNAKGLLPLHVACSYRASTDVIRALVTACPKSAGMQTPVSGSTPLHLLCENGCSVDAIRVILETKAGLESVSQEDRRFHQTPLQLLHARTKGPQFNRSINDLQSKLRRQQEQKDTQTSLQEQQQTTTPNWPDGVHQWLLEFWHKAVLLMLAEFHSLQSSSNRPATFLPSMDLSIHSHVVHACLGIARCPPSVLKLAMLLHPEQLLLPDEDGRLPLHIAASKLYHDSSINDIFSDLIKACPQAAQHRDAHQQIPLQLCGACGWNEPLARLVLAYPLGLTAMDFDDALYPRIWALVALRRNCSVLFELIREKPNIFVRHER